MMQSVAYPTDDMSYDDLVAIAEELKAANFRMAYIRLPVR